MNLVAKSDLSTGNTIHASYALQSGQMTMLFSAPYSYSTSSSTTTTTSSSSLSSSTSSSSSSTTTTIAAAATATTTTMSPLPGFECSKASEFFNKHGLGVKAVCIEVDDVNKAYDTIINNNGISILSPIRIYDNDSAKGYVDLAEVRLYGDVVLRLINSSSFKGNFLPNFNDIGLANTDTNDNNNNGNYGLTRFDHIVGNLWSLEPLTSSIKGMTGFHEFAEFVADDVGTVDSGLNSVVLANTNEMVLLPLNEPTFGTKRKSQIQTYLEQNNGEGMIIIVIIIIIILFIIIIITRCSTYGSLYTKYLPYITSDEGGNPMGRVRIHGPAAEELLSEY